LDAWDPIKWSEIERGHWVAQCVCGTERYYEPVGVNRVRLDPVDPRTARHLPQCEFVSETNPATLKVLLKARERDGYWWVECGSCQAGWQGSVLRRGEQRVTTKPLPGRGRERSLRDRESARDQGEDPQPGQAAALGDAALRERPSGPARSSASTTARSPEPREMAQRIAR
jgi:hypothetical protein